MAIHLENRSNRARTVAILNHRGERLAELRAGLQDLGWQVRSSRDLETSLELLRAHQPQAAIIAPLSLRADNLEWQHLLASLRETAWLVLPWANADASTTSTLFQDPQTTADWLEAPFDAMRANLRLNNLLYRQAELFAMEQQQKLLTEQLRIDERTGLGNKRHFEECLKCEYERACRQMRPLSQIFMDLVQFGKVNTTHGHEFGEYVLQHIGAIIKDALRATDIPSRWGGDEFKLLLPDTSTEDALQVIKRLQKSFSRHRIVMEDKELEVSCYFGLATFSGEKGIGVAQFNSQVDQALKRAKELGPNAIAIWDPGKNRPMPDAESEPDS